MADRLPFTVRDGVVVAIAVAAAAGAWRGGGPGVPAAIAVLVVALAVRRPALLCAAVAIAGAGLADRALAGLDPVARAPVAGWVTLVTDPAPLDHGGFAVDVRVDGRRLEATAFGAAGHALADRLAGERVEVSGVARPPPDDAPWLVARRVVGRLTIDEVSGWAHGSLVTRAANGVRRTLEGGAAGLSRAGRSLLTGVVLGDDRDQPPEVTDDFRAAGLTHLLAVSGSNVAFALAVARPLLSRLRWSARLPATLAILGAFALLVRFEPSVLRATAMAAIATVAAAVGRPTAGIRILALAVTGLVLVDPLLVRSVGFGLSVAASASILVLAPRLRLVLPGPAWFAEPLAVTLAAQVGTVPLLLAVFGGVPVAGVPANLLAVPAAGPLMVWGLTAGLAAGVLAPLAGALHVPTAALTWWLAAVARWSAGAPLGEVGRPHAVALGLALGACLGLRRLGVGHPARLAAAAVASVVVVVVAGRPALPGGPTTLGGSATVWSAGGATVLLLDGPASAVRTLEALRRSGGRCVDVVAVAGGGRSAAITAAALQRRCAGLAIVAAAGRAHPGWEALASGTALDVGGLRITSTTGGELRVGSSADAAARAPPRARGRRSRRRRRRRPSAGPRRAVARGGAGRGAATRRRRARRPSRGHRDPGDRRCRRGDALNPPVHLVRGDDPSLVRDAVRRLVDELLGDGDRSLTVDEHVGEYEVNALVDAAQTPPFLTERRVVVGRDLHQFKAEQLVPLAEYLADPLPTTALVLVWETGAVPKGLLDAFKKAGGAQVDTSPGRTARDQRSWLTERIAESGVHLDKGAVDLIAQTLGEDVSRLSGLLGSLGSTFGPGARLGAAEVAPYLGEGGGVAPWELTDAIDRGDIPLAVDRLHRLLRGGDRHALVVLATLHNHVQRMLALDGSGARSEKEAAEILGVKGSTFPARKALEQGRRLGGPKVARAVELLAQADVDLRGAKAWPDDLVLEVLVARLAFLARR